MRAHAKTLFGVAALVTALYGLGVLLHRDVRQPNLVVLPADMAHSPAARTGDRTPAFANGIVQQEPPEGTIARGTTPLAYVAGEPESKRAGRELSNPFGDEEAVLARGRSVFENVCSACHGTGGLGDAPVTKRRFPPPPSLLRPETKALPDGELFHVITFGRNNMPPAASIVDREDRWKVVRYLRKLQEKS